MSNLDDGLQPVGPRDMLRVKGGGVIVVPRAIGGGYTGYVPLKSRIHRPPGYVTPRPKQATVFSPEKSPLNDVALVAGVIESSRALPAPHAAFKAPVMRRKTKAPAPAELAPEVVEIKPASPAKHLMILRPAYKLTDELVSYVSMALFDKQTMGYEVRRGDAVIFHSRNILADIFMKSTYEWSLWWDDDMIPSVGNPAWTKSNIPGVPKEFPDNFLSINPISRLLQHNKTIIGGLYFGRNGNHSPICQRTTDDASRFRKAPENAIMARKWVGTGFLLVHRSVYTSIQEKFPELAPVKTAVNQWERVWDYFRPTEQQAEDVSFCHRALECGHQPYVDLGNIVSHLGNHAYGPWDQK